MEIIKGKMTEKDKVKREIREGNIEEAATWLKSTIINGATKRDTNRRARPWFDRECYEQRKLTLKILHKTRGQMASATTEQYQQEWKKYKVQIRTKKKQHLVEQQKKMVDEAEEDRKGRKHSPTSPWKDHIRKSVQKKQDP
ncbi:hypothetical protein C0J52_10783 [Blattella germanica]|nr:hypothetical protein C0J52_10783 [Blattella germanica]